MLYSPETRERNTGEGRKAEEFDLKCLRAALRVNVMDRVKNMDIREIFRSGRSSMVELMDQSILKWFGYVERIDDEALTKRVYNSEVEEAKG